MLGFVDNQLVRLEPVLEPRELTVKLIDGQIQAYAGTEPLVTGVSYYVMHEDPGLDVALDRRTGAFNVTKGYGVARLRAVMAGGHVEAELIVERPTNGQDVA